MVRLRPKTVCKVVGKTLAQAAQATQEQQEQQEQLEPRDGKMALKGRDVHRMFAHLSSTLSNREKGELQLHLLKSMTEEEATEAGEEGGEEGEGGKVEGEGGTLQESGQEKEGKKHSFWKQARK